MRILQEQEAQSEGTLTWLSFPVIIFTVIGGPEMGRAPDDLFDFMKRTSSTKVALDRLLIWIRRKKERFPSFVVLSFVPHVKIFGFLAVSWAVSEKPRGATAGLDNAAAARQALGALRLDAKESALLSGALACLTEDQLEEVLERAPELDSVLGEYREEQEKIYRVSRINALFQEGSRKSSTDDLARLRKFHIWEKRSAKLRADGVNER